MVQSAEVRFIVHNRWLSLKRCRSIGVLSKHLDYTAGLRSWTKMCKPKRMMEAMQFISVVCGDKGQAWSRFEAPQLVEGVPKSCSVIPGID
jgi:hypothetical protein